MPNAQSLLTQLNAGISRVLIIDDDFHIYSGLKDILQDAGYQAEMGNCAADAFDYLDRQTFGILVVDYALPDANGMEIAATARTRYPWLETILMTGHDRVELTETEKQMPLLAAFLRKPIDVHTLLSVIEQILHRQCDRYNVPRFSPQSASIISSKVLPPTVEVRSAPPVLPPIEAPPISLGKIPFPMWVPGLVLAAFVIGWFAHAWLQIHRSIEIRPIAIAQPVPVRPPVSVEVAPNPPIAQVVTRMKTQAPSPSAKGTRTRANHPVVAAAPEPAGPDWNALLESPNPAIRVQAAKSLLKLPPGYDKAAASLLALARDSDAHQRLVAIEAISNSGLVTPAIVSALAESLRDGDPEVASAAAKALARAGDAAIPAIPKLMEAVSNSSDERAVVRTSAQHAVVQLGKAAVPALMDMLDDPETRESAVDMLGAIGPGAQDAVPDLTKLENDPAVGIAAMKAAAQIQPYSDAPAQPGTK